jgi:asparagine synthase (glutamine-hydrolysing)
LLRDRDPLWLFRRFFHHDLPPLTAVRYLDLKTYLPDDILTKVDRASMACSLEVRVPLLDHRLVEYAFDLDDRLLGAHPQGKAVLREAMAGKLPDLVLERPKSGFSSPVRRWLREGLAAGLADPTRWTIAEAGLVRPAFVREMMRNRSFNRWAKLWSLLVLERWHQRWIAAASG